MANGNDKLSDQELLKAENDFLKMKLMLEHGAEFHFPENGGDRLDPAIENQFLQNIVALENEHYEEKIVKIFDKVGRPAQFRAVEDIPEHAFEDEWEKLLDHLQKHGVELTVCNPKVTAKELYRFTVEEMFAAEMDDSGLPGTMNTFIYDLFYPDAEYDNTEHAVNECIEVILSNTRFTYIPWLLKNNLKLNHHSNLTSATFWDVINKFKDGLDDVKLMALENVQCNLGQTSCAVTGSYKVRLAFDSTTVTVAGNWLVDFILEDEFWYINNVQLENLNL